VTAYKFIQANLGTWTVMEMAALFGASACAYYRWAKHGVSLRRRDDDARLLELIRGIVERHKKRVMDKTCCTQNKHAHHKHPTPCSGLISGLHHKFCPLPIIATYMGLAAGLVILYLVCVIAVSVLGGMIDYATRVFPQMHLRFFSPEDTFRSAPVLADLPLLVENILVRFPVNLADRFVVVFGGYFTSRGLVRILPITRNASQT